MDPSPIQAHPLPTQDVHIKTEERARPIPPQPLPRVQRYKDKFQVLRERYDTVTAAHTEHTRAMQRATEKEQRLQAEINMLLDAALSAAAPQFQSSSATPTGSQAPAPAPPRAPSASTPPVPAQTLTPTPTHPPASSPAPQASASLAPASTPGPHVPHAHTNGHASLAPPHPHAHVHGATNHAPPAPPPHGGVPLEGSGAVTYAGAEYVSSYRSSSSSSPYYASPTVPATAGGGGAHNNAAVGAPGPTHAQIHPSRR